MNKIIIKWWHRLRSFVKETSFGPINILLFCNTFYLVQEVWWFLLCSLAFCDFFSSISPHVIQLHLLCHTACLNPVRYWLLVARKYESVAVSATLLYFFICISAYTTIFPFNAKSLSSYIHHILCFKIF